MSERSSVALVYEEHGRPEEVLKIKKLELPPLRDGEVKIKMEAAAIHPSDLGMIGGSYGRLRDLPAVGGREGVGQVVETGPGVAATWESTRVRIPEHVGVWQSEQIASVEGLARIPEGVSSVQAALAAVNPTTAIRLLEDFEPLQPGDWVVQNAGNSAVGVAVIQLAKSKGLLTASLVRRGELFEPLKRLGANLVVLDERSAPERIREARGDSRMPLGLNSIGGSSLLNLAQSVSDGGTVVTFGGMTGEKIRFPTRQLIFNDIGFRGFWMDRWNREHSSEEVSGLLDEVYKLIRDEVIVTPVAAVYSLADYREALQQAQSYRMGKVLFGNV
ncbi:MAG: 2-enoyl thioester reductase domain-containing protein [Verrucomicrobiota bacterium]